MGDGPGEQTTSDRLRETARKHNPNKEEEPAEGWSEGGYCGKAMRLTFIFALIVSVLLVLGVWWLTGKTGEGLISQILWSAAVVLLVGYWGYLFCIYIYRTWTIKYRLTTYRFYHEEGIFRRVRDVVEVIDMDDIKLEQTLWDRLINGGVGTIIIQSADASDPNLVLRGLENPERAFQALDDTRRKQRVERGLKYV